MKNMILRVMSVVGLMLCFSQVFAGDLEGGVIKYAVGTMDIDYGNKDYVLIDVDDSVVTECSVYPLGNDVVFMEINSTLWRNQSAFEALVAAQSAGTSTVKIGYHTYSSTAVGTDICIFDSIVVISP